MRPVALTRGILFTVALGFTAALATSSASAQAATDLDERAFYRKKFDGWGGIVFRCLYDTKRDFDRRVCENATTDARFLAAAGKVPFRAVEGETYYSVAFVAALMKPKALILEANVRSSAASGHIGVSLLLLAGNFYSDAVDKSEAKGPESIPRGGTLVLWDRHVVGSGQVGSEFENALKNAFDTLLKNFFSLFLEHWRNPTEPQ